MELIDWVDENGVEWSHSPDGRRVCSSCGCWSYEPHYSHCKHSQPKDKGWIVNAEKVAKYTTEAGTIMVR